MARTSKYAVSFSSKFDRHEFLILPNFQRTLLFYQIFSYKEFCKVAYVMCAANSTTQMLTSTSEVCELI